VLLSNTDITGQIGVCGQLCGGDDWLQQVGCTGVGWRL